MTETVLTLARVPRATPVVQTMCTMSNKTINPQKIAAVRVKRVQRAWPTKQTRTANDANTGTTPTAVEEAPSRLGVRHRHSGAATSRMRTLLRRHLRHRMAFPRALPSRPRYRPIRRRRRRPRPHRRCPRRRHRARRHPARPRPRRRLPMRPPHGTRGSTMAVARANTAPHREALQTTDPLCAVTIPVATRIITPRRLIGLVARQMGTVLWP